MGFLVRVPSKNTTTDRGAAGGQIDARASDWQARTHGIETGHVGDAQTRTRVSLVEIGKDFNQLNGAIHLAQAGRAEAGGVVRGAKRAPIQVQTAIDFTTPSEDHRAVLQGALQDINSVPLGYDALRDLAADTKPLFVASLDPERLPDGRVAEEFYSDPLRGAEPDRANAAVYVNTAQLEALKRQARVPKAPAHAATDSGAHYARALSEVYLKIVQAKQGLVARKKGGGGDAGWLIDNTLAFALRDKFYGELTHGRQESDFFLRFSSFLASPRLPGGSLMNSFEEIIPDKVHVYQQIANQQPRWLRLGMSLVDTGPAGRPGESLTPLVSILNDDDRRYWSHYKTSQPVNDPRMSVSDSVLRRRDMARAATSGMSRVSVQGYMDSFYFYYGNAHLDIKVDRQERTGRAIELLRAALHSRQYKAEDFEMLRRGLELHTPLRRFFEEEVPKYFGGGAAALDY